MKYWRYRNRLTGELRSKESDILNEPLARESASNEHSGCYDRNGFPVRGNECRTPMDRMTVEEDVESAVRTWPATCRLTLGCRVLSWAGVGFPGES